ncbi:UNVERIFIED_CONTAM: hypothetical protein Scaly_3036100 [Sesamum calycinum]|uniref:Integrase catalytic domain-containing protein n=1 Tax=Sesamum calycinum TaxID=2727403 RepID=A0AAW2K6Q6_9LAMI
MLSLVEKLEDLKVGLDNDTYIDVILQLLHSSYNPFIINYNMNGLDNMIHELNLCQLRGRGKRARERSSQPLPASRAPLLQLRVRAEVRLEVLSGRRQMIFACIAKERGTGRESVHNSSPTQVLEKSRKLSKDEIILKLGVGRSLLWKLLEVENQIGCKIKALRSDQGGEYLSSEFIDYLKENEILSQWTPPRMPQLNGMAERRNRTLLDMVRSTMSFTKLPPSFWGYSLETAATVERSG